MNTNPTVNAPERIVGIPAGLETLTRTVDILHEHIDKLSERLTPVLLDSRPETAQDPGERPSMCQHHTSIETEVDRLDSLIRVVKDLSDRLQV